VSVRRLLAAALVAAIATVGLAAQPAVAAPSSASVVVAPDGGGVVRTGQDLDVAITVTNTGSDALPAGRVTTSLDPAPVASTSTLLNLLAHPPAVLQGNLTLAKGRVPALEAGDSATIRLTLTAEDIASILTSASGARLLYAQYRSGTGTTIAETIAESSIVRMASGSGAQVGFGAVVPVLAPRGTTGVVDTTTQAQLSGPDGAWSAALRAAEAFPAATVALDPAVIASIRLAGEAAPPEATGFLEALSRLPNETVRLPYADADVTLERAAGLGTAVSPSSFAGVTVVSSDPAAPAPSPGPTTGVVPTSTAELTAWNWSEQVVDWPVPHSASAADLTAFGAKGEAVLLPSDDVVDTPARRTAGPLASVRSTKVLVADATTSSLLAKAASDDPGGDAALATLTGLLATAAVTGETTALVATAGRSADPARLDRVLGTLGRQSWIQGRSLTQLTTGTATPVALRTRSLPTARLETAKALVDGEHDVQELGRAIPTGQEVVTAPQRLTLLGLLSASWRSDDAAWQTAAAATEQAFRRVIGQVHLVTGSESNAIGTDGTLRVSVVNELPVPVKVVVRASVSNGRLQFPDDRAAVTVPAEASTVAKLAYRSITNGKTQVSLRLETRNGATLDTGDRQFTVSAGFDTIIAVVLLTALGLLLALGVYRNVKRRRQPRTVAA